MRWILVDRRWHPVDDGTLPYALAAMRSLWVWPLFHLLTTGMAAGQADLLGWPMVFLLLAGSTAVAQLAAYRLRPGRVGRLARLSDRVVVALCGLVAVILALYLGLPGPRPALWDWHWLDALFATPLRTLGTLFVAMWLWWWGVLAGRDTLYYDTYASNFALGAAMLGLIAACGYATQTLQPGALLGPALAFFALGLATLAIASLRSARRFERERGEPTFRVNRYWLATVGGVIVALLATGLLLAQLISPDLVRRILAFLSPIVSLLAHALYWVLMLVTWVVFIVLSQLARLVHLPTETEREPLQLQDFSKLTEQFKDIEAQPVGLSPGLYVALRILAGLLIAGIVVLIFALAFRRFRAYSEEDVEEVRESILSLDLLKTQIGQLLRRQHKETPPPFAVVAGDDPRARIRRIYQALLAWAAAAGQTRPPGATPGEYLALLAGHHPERQPLLATITAAYIQARYCPDPLPAELADEAQRAWEQFLL